MISEAGVYASFLKFEVVADAIISACSILKLLNQRRLESLKETWWNQNSEKKECDEEGKNNDGISIKNIGTNLMTFDLN